MHISKIFFLVLVACVIVLPVRGQQQFGYSSEAERMFSAGTRLFQNGHFGEAQTIFDSIGQETPLHQRTTAAIVMAAKAQFQTRQYRASAIRLVNFLKKYPDSRYGDDARYTLALDYLMLEWFAESAFQFLRSIETTDDQQVLDRSTELFEAVTDDHCTIVELQHVLPKVTKAEVRDLVLVKIAEKLYASGEAREAGEIVDRILQRDHPGVYVTRLRTLRERGARINAVKIGVVLPLMGKLPSSPLKVMAEELYDGITYALADSRKEQSAGRNVSLEVRDVERDSAATVGAVKGLCESSDVVAIIGPLFSGLALASAPIAEASGVPIISPTASAVGLASIGPHIFQANPDLAMRGRLMARFIVQRMGLTTVAVLATRDPLVKASAESFVEEATLLGATVVAAEWYDKGASDLSEAFLNIRKTGFPAGTPPDTVAELSTPVTNIQAIYVPIADAEEIGIIGPQLKYFNIQSRLFGTGEWYDIAQLESNKRYVNGTIFLSDSFVSSDDSVFVAFEKAFFAEKKKHSSKYTLFGYDTMKLVLQQIQDGAATRDRLAVSLATVRGFVGLHSKITFAGSRVNSEMHVLKFINGEVLKLADISLN